MTPKPSDSLSERARELREKLANVFAYALDQHKIHGIDPWLLADRAMPVIEKLLADAFNLGAGVAYEDAVQKCRGKVAKEDGLTVGEVFARIIEQRTSADTLAAVERKVAQARLDEARWWDSHSQGRAQRIAQLQAEAAKEPK